MDHQCYWWPLFFASKQIVEDKLYQDLTKKFYTDIKIILVDPHNTISIHAHKNVLGYASAYFHNLFNFGKEKNQSTIRIENLNAKIAHDVILSLYNHPDVKIKSSSAKYLLEMFKCRSFFCLPFC